MHLNPLLSSFFHIHRIKKKCWPQPTTNQQIQNNVDIDHFFSEIDFSFIPLLSSAVLGPNPVPLHSPRNACPCVSACARVFVRVSVKGMGDLMMNCRRGFWDGWLKTFLGSVGLSQCDVHCLCATWNKGRRPSATTTETPAQIWIRAFRYPLIQLLLFKRLCAKFHSWLVITTISY